MKKNKVINFAKTTLKNDRLIVIMSIVAYAINETYKAINNIMDQGYNFVINKGDFTIILTKDPIENNNKLTMQ